MPNLTLKLHKITLLSEKTSRSTELTGRVINGRAMTLVIRTRHVVGPTFVVGLQCVVVTTPLPLTPLSPSHIYIYTFWYRYGFILYTKSFRRQPYACSKPWMKVTNTL